VPEARRLASATLTKPVPLNRVLAWSAWRRRHQATAKASHCKHRAHIKEAQLKQ
jgi:hypothetical protein